MGGMRLGRRDAAQREGCRWAGGDAAGRGGRSPWKGCSQAGGGCSPLGGMQVGRGVPPGLRDASEPRACSPPGR